LAGKFHLLVVLFGYDLLYASFLLWQEHCSFELLTVGHYFYLSYKKGEFVCGMFSFFSVNGKKVFLALDLGQPKYSAQKNPFK
jgi:hypothetical protein